MKDSYILQEPLPSTTNTSPKPKEADHDSFTKSFQERQVLSLKQCAFSDTQFSAKFGMEY